MVRQTMNEKAQEIYDSNEIEYLQTEGNTHVFQALQHTKTETNPYMIECKITDSNQLEWTCSCYYGTHNDTCKHIMAGELLLMKRQLRKEYKEISNDNE